MNEVQRFDYSKPPPGYETVRLDGEAMYRREGCRLLSLDGPYGAWAYYKKDNDPPHLHPNDGSERMAAAFSSPVAEWRAAAWRWHDRRHALAGRLTLQDAWPRCLRWTDAECDQVDRWIADGEETPECFWVRLKPVDYSDVRQLVDSMQPKGLSVGLGDGSLLPPGIVSERVPSEIDLANYEQTGSPFDAETMWTCRACRGRPHKSQRVDREGPEHVRHAPGCKVARSEAASGELRQAIELLEADAEGVKT